MRPICHGIKISPSYRTERDGKVYIMYQCMTCGRKNEVQTSNGV
jgi:hypothetical protein